MALINDRDQYHDIAVEIAETHTGNQMITTDAVLLEVANGSCSLDAECEC